jgi:hypothetical protein
MTLTRIFYGVVVPDFAMTFLVAVVERRPRLLLAAPFFPFMRVLDAGIGLGAIPQAWLARSDGVWKSPTRRAAPGRHREAAARQVAATAVPRHAPAAAGIPAVPAAAEAAYAEAGYPEAGYPEAAAYAGEAAAAASE